MIKNNLKIISEHLGFKHPVTEISKDLGWSKGQVSQYYNDKIAMSDNFKNKFANYYNVKFSDFHDPPKDEINFKNNNPEHMRDLLNAQERIIASMEKTISTLEDRIRDLERENFFSTKSLPERDESEEDKRVR